MIWYREMNSMEQSNKDIYCPWRNQKWFTLMDYVDWELRNFPSWFISRQSVWNKKYSYTIRKKIAQPMQKLTKLRVLFSVKKKSKQGQSKVCKQIADTLAIVAIKTKEPSCARAATLSTVCRSCCRLVVVVLSSCCRRVVVVLSLHHTHKVL